MKKEEALETFLEEEASRASSKFVFESMTCFDKKHKKDTTAWFCSKLRQILQEAPELYFLQITLLRSKALIGLPFYRLEAYGADLYLSEPLMTRDLEFDHLYQSYHRFSEELELESRKYILQIGKEELNQIKLAELYNCQKIMKHLFLETVAELIGSGEFQALNADRNIQFHLSEYRGEYEILLTKDRKMEQMGGWLCELLQAE